MPTTGGICRKVKPILDTYILNIIIYYSPGQELSVGEGMVKYKRWTGGKVWMPKKPVKWEFKIWCCSCACCGYLYMFQVYQGKPTGPITT